MKSIIILIMGLSLVGCDTKVDPLASVSTLTPREVIRLHKVCQSQPDYYNSWVNTRGGKAKSVTCSYRDSNNKKSGIPQAYDIDAQVLEGKMKEVDK